jgi:tyrosyl-tRNA synthetase
VQLGGDDQWFNILGGVDLIRRKASGEAHALTTPLLATADGKKMGKTEKGAVFIDPARVSPYDYYQYWVNVADADVERFLKMYTFLDMARIEPLAALQGADVRQAKAVLAWEATALAHGESEANQAQEAARKLFAGGGVSADMPTLTVALPAPLVDLYVAAGLTKSKGAARRLIRQGGARIDQDKITDAAAVLDREAVLWAGKKRAVRILTP